MDKLPDALERLTTRVEALEQRIAALEAVDHVSSAALSTPVAHVPSIPQTAVTGEGLFFAQTGGAFSLLGKAMLGIAGAYLLRAIAESTSLPRLLIAAVAIVYALAWLVASVRVPVTAWFACTVYAGTSALILAPMLWELTLRFKVLPASATAGVLCVFVITATALGWKQDRAPVFWGANIAAAGSALTLSIFTHALAPFIASLLLMALLCEFAAGRGHERSVRLLVTAAADLAVWALIFIYSSPANMRTDYPAIGRAGLLLPGLILFLIYAASVVLQTTALGHKISIFETIQTMIAFLLAASGLIYFAPTNSSVVLGLACFLMSIACYAVVIALFGKSAEGRNYHVFATWAAGLFLAGSLLSLPTLGQTICLSLAAIAAIALTNRMTLKFHGLVYLLTAAIASGLFKFTISALAGAAPSTLTASVWLAAACALVCYAASQRVPQQNWQPQILQLVSATLSIISLVALLVDGSLWLTALHATPEAHHVAFVRTLILCATSLVLAFAGSRLRRLEMTRIAYATLAILTVKLLFEDLRLGHLEFIAAAIFFFAITLIAVPRLAHIAHKSSEPSHTSHKTVAT